MNQAICARAAIPYTIPHDLSVGANKRGVEKLEIRKPAQIWGLGNVWATPANCL
jgi:hypothetical protein